MAADRLDFELEEPLVESPVLSRRRKKVIGLDDLLKDHYKEEGKRIERDSKKKKVRESENSDDEDNIKEATLSNTLDQYQKQMKELGGEDEISHWGILAFRAQKNLPDLVFAELDSCALVQCFQSSNLSLFQVGAGEGCQFLEGLLVNGWLSNLIILRRHVEPVIAKWTFNLMMFSSREELRTSACDFSCGIFSAKDEDIKIDWVPGYSDFEKVLDIYGFTFDVSSDLASGDADLQGDGPPQNIRAFMKYVAASCSVRHKWPLFSPSEAEELTEVIIWLFLDRRLEGLSVLLYECLQSIINYFTENEWKGSCEKIAKSLAKRVPKDLNCLRAVECISGVDTRSKLLKSEVAHQVLVNCLDNKVADDEEILGFLIAINVKEKSCDLFKLYIYLVLTEHWLLSNSVLDDKQVIDEMWGVFLRNCSCQITSADLRSYASKVRNRASYLLQGSTNK